MNIRTPEARIRRIVELNEEKRKIEEEMLKLLGEKLTDSTEQNFSRKNTKVGKVKKKYTEWSQEEDNFLIKSSTNRVPMKKVAKELGRTKSAVNARLVKLRNDGKAPVVGGRFKTWTDEELNYLERSMGHLPANVIAKNLGRTRKAVDARIWKIKSENGVKSEVKKAEEFVEVEKKVEATPSLISMLSNHS